MKNCAFTICTKNYIGLASVLGKSIFNYYKDLDFFVFVADEFDVQEQKLPENVIVVKNLGVIPEHKWINFSFKYNLTEFCTTLKPFIFKYLFDNTQAERICYIDPDILFFSSIEPIYKALDNCLVELTPHFVSFPETEISRKLEDEIKFTGLYNLGFIGLKRHEKVFRILDWWANNLSDKGFSNPDKAQYTDQKWMDFMTIYFDTVELCINRNIGLNVAPWNFFERKVSKSGSTFYVENRNQATDKTPIIFVHFSGINYKKLMNEQIAKEKTITHVIEYDDVDILMQEYAASLQSQKQTIDYYLGMQYSYGKFCNGIAIDTFQRRIYDSYCNEFPDKHDNPFDENSHFFKLLKRKKMLGNVVVQSQQVRSDDSSWKTNRTETIKRIFKLIYLILGYRKYPLFLSFIKRFVRVDNQLFLLGNKN